MWCLYNQPICGECICIRLRSHQIQRCEESFPRHLLCSRCDRVHVTLRLSITCLSNLTQMHHSKLQDSTVVFIPCYGNYVRNPPAPRHIPRLLSSQRPVWCECSLNLSSWPKSFLIRTRNLAAIQIFFLIVFDKHILITFSWQECS